MKVLVCGGRDFTDRDALFAALDKIDAELPRPGITCIISGCARGADSLALQWSKKWDLVCRFFPADWKRHGSAAGPIRNQEMLERGKPDLVIAFPGGRGTADMVRRARAVNVRVIEPLALTPTNYEDQK